MGRASRRRRLLPPSPDRRSAVELPRKSLMIGTTRYQTGAKSQSNWEETMVVRRKITERNVTLHNPCPKGMSEVDVWDEVGIFEPSAREDVPAFRVDYRWAPGDASEEEAIRLDPGDSIEVRSTEGRMIFQALSDRGVVVLEDGEELTVEKTLQALNRAKNFFAERGARQIVNFQRTHGLSEEEMKVQKGRVAPYFYNKEREKLIDAEITRLQGERKGRKSNKTQED